MTRSRMFTAAAALIAAVLPIMPSQPALAEIPVTPQYVCEIDSGSLAPQIVVVTADAQVGPPDMNNPCSVMDQSTAPPSVNAGHVVFLHVAALRQYVCDLSSGPLAGRLVLLSRSTPPGFGEPCTDGAGSEGTVAFVEQ